MTWRLMAGFLFLFFPAPFVSARMGGGGGMLVTQLTANLPKDGTSATVSSSSGFLASGYVFLEGERIAATVNNGTTFTLAGKHDAHPSGSKVLSESAGVLNSLMGFNVGAANASVGVTGMILETTSALRHAVPKVMLWDYSYLDNDMGTLLKLLFFFPLSAGFSWAVIMAFVYLRQGLL